MTKGLLLAMMEPPVALEAEFNDWYDTEHLPERAAVDGFLSACRFVCIEGTPRYLALYDLERVEVLHAPSYAAVGGANQSAWSKRTQGFVGGLLRAEGVQLHPGNALTGDQGRAARLALWHFRGVPEPDVARIVPGLRALYEDRPETAQLRVFRIEHDGEIGYVGLVELRLPLPFAGLDLAPLGGAARCIDALNTYVPYAAAAACPGCSSAPAGWLSAASAGSGWRRDSPPRRAARPCAT
jgi:hypothetical protein